MRRSDAWAAAWAAAIDPDLRALVDKILASPSPPRQRRHKQRHRGELVGTHEAQPPQPAVVIQAPRGTPPDLIAFAAAVHAPASAPTLEPVPRPSSDAVAYRVACMLCGRVPGSVSLPLRNHRCEHCGFRALMAAHWLDAA